MNGSTMEQAPATAIQNGARHSPPQYQGLGTLIRMRALKASELPANPALSSAQTTGTPPSLQGFLTAALKEALGFMTDYLPKKFNVKSSGKSSPPSAASVELLAHEIGPNDLPKEALFTDASAASTETWFARTSLHENAPKAGTASFEEFDGGLRANHSQHEMDYTPDVIDAHKVTDWDQQLQSELNNTVGNWTDVNMYIVEMRHKIPPPLNNRVFPVLVITAKRAREFIVVQIPVDHASIPGAKYHLAPKITTGMYCSIEFGQVVADGATVKWQMATASDAKGVLPMWAQKMGVPGAVVKDVGLFIGWCEKRRKSAS